MSRIVAGYIFLTLLQVHIVQSCKDYQIQSCRYFEKISTTKFHAFIPMKEHMQTCSDLDIALRCALDPQYTAGCGDKTTISYVSQYNVIKAVCHDRKEDYFNSTNCFFSDDLEGVIQRCLNTATYMMPGDDICEKIEETRDCVYDVLEERKETCSEKNKFLMGKLVVLYLKPKGQNCDIKPREGEEDPTTTSTTQSTTTTTTTTELTTETPRALGVRETLQPVGEFDGAVAILPSIILHTLASLVLVQLLG